MKSIDQPKSNMDSNSISYWSWTCRECEIFLKTKFGFCPVSQIEVSPDHHSCPNFKKNYQQMHQSSAVQNTGNSGLIGLHINSFKRPDNCQGPNPKYCTSHCPSYWSCSLILDEVKKK